MLTLDGVANSPHDRTLIVSSWCNFMSFRFFSWYRFHYLPRIGFDNTLPLPFVFLVLFFFPILDTLSLVFTTVILLVLGSKREFSCSLASCGGSWFCEPLTFHQNHSCVQSSKRCKTIFFLLKLETFSFANSTSALQHSVLASSFVSLS